MTKTVFTLVAVIALGISSAALAGPGSNNGANGGGTGSGNGHGGGVGQGATRNNDNGRF